MLVKVNRTLGIGDIPKDKTSALKWMRRNDIALTSIDVDGGKAFVVPLADLPKRERIAFLELEIERAGLNIGQYDDAAHVVYLSAPASIRAAAEYRASTVRVLRSLGVETSWNDRLVILRKKFGDDAPSKVTLKRYLALVKDVDPINFAPALMPKYKTHGAPKAATDDKAWSLFMTIVRDAAPTFPLVQAWRDVRDIAKAQGLKWPSYSTVFRRWTALPMAQQLAARYGKTETVKRLTQPALRDKTTLRVLECVSLDGRTQDYWTDIGDGKAVRLTMIALIDVATNLVLGYELAPSENAVSTARVIRRVCAKFGIFDMLYTDNGSAFAGHLIAGGVDHKFRNAATNAGLRPLGICHHLGIDLKFAMPGNPQAKIAERVFATLSRCLDDRPEFQMAHAGHNPGASPSAEVIPVPLETVESVVAREINRYNVETGRRSQGANGRSY
jgi:putative transposase